MDDPTLLIHWLFSWLAMIIIAVRLVWRRIAWRAFNAGDYLSMAAIVCALIRLGMIHVVLTYGTNNVSAAIRKTHVFTPEEIQQRELGSKLAVANRVFYNSYLWLQKLVLMDVYRRLYRSLWYEKILNITVAVVFFGTYVACQVVTFSECNPFHLYWQVVPDPGSCSQAQLQLIVVGVLNIVTDVMLLVIPLPIVFQLSTATWQRRGQLLSLFLLGIFVILTTVIRLPINAFNKDSQVNRTTWASIELLVSAIVVNAPTIYGVWNKRRQDSKYAISTSGGGINGGTVGGTGAQNIGRRGSRYGMGSKYGLGSAHGRHSKIQDEESGSEGFDLVSAHRGGGSKDGITMTREVIVQSEDRATSEERLPSPYLRPDVSRGKSVAW